MSEALYCDIVDVLDEHNCELGDCLYALGCITAEVLGMLTDYQFDQSALDMQEKLVTAVFKDVCAADTDNQETDSITTH